MKTTSDLENLNNLNRILTQARKSPFYAERLKDAPRKLSNLKDIELLPFTTKQDLRNCYNRTHNKQTFFLLSAMVLLSIAMNSYSLSAGS